MRLDSLKKYISLREELTREKQDLEQRLAAINQALGEASESTSTERAAAPAPRQVASAKQKSSPLATGRRGRPAKSGLSLREAVIQVLSAGPKTKEQVLAGVKGLGYQFTTNDPMNSLGVILYGKNPKLKRENGQFSLGGSTGNAGSAVPARASQSGKRGGRRQMSEEGRARIAAAQRARWAKSKGGK